MTLNLYITDYDLVWGFPSLFSCMSQILSNLYLLLGGYSMHPIFSSSIISSTLSPFLCRETSKWYLFQIKRTTYIGEMTWDESLMALPEVQWYSLLNLSQYWVLNLYCVLLFYRESSFTGCSDRIEAKAYSWPKFNPQKPLWSPETTKNDPWA